MEKPRIDKNRDAFCAECRPRLEPEALGPETNAPLNCTACGRLLECSLTADAVGEVLEIVDTFVKHWAGVSTEKLDNPGNHYHGMRAVEPTVEVVRDIARYYTLPDAQENLLRRFLLLADDKQVIVTEDDGDPD